MQYNFTKDIAGSATTVSTTSPQWLRLSRSGDTLTGYESADGQNWTKIGVAKLSGLPASVPVGLLVTSPDNDVTTEEVIGTSTQGGPSIATATFDGFSLLGHSSGTLQGGSVGDNGLGDVPPFTQSGGTFTLSGSGDIGPLASSGGDNNTVSGSLARCIRRT